MLRITTLTLLALAGPTLAQAAAGLRRPQAGGAGLVDRTGNNCLGTFVLSDVVDITIR